MPLGLHEAVALARLLTEGEFLASGTTFGGGLASLGQDAHQRLVILFAERLDLHFL